MDFAAGVICLKPRTTYPPPLHTVYLYTVALFLYLPDPDPDPLVRGMCPDPDPAPDPSVIKQNSKKNLDS
jgi:hypothetical protein